MPDVPDVPDVPESTPTQKKAKPPRRGRWVDVAMHAHSTLRQPRAPSSSTLPPISTADLEPEPEEPPACAGAGAADAGAAGVGSAQEVVPWEKVTKKGGTTKDSSEEEEEEEVVTLEDLQLRWPKRVIYKYPTMFVHECLIFVGHRSQAGFWEQDQLGPAGGREHLSLGSLVPVMVPRRKPLVGGMRTGGRSVLWC